MLNHSSQGWSVSNCISIQEQGMSFTAGTFLRTEGDQGCKCTDDTLCSVIFGTNNLDFLWKT